MEGFVKLYSSMLQSSTWYEKDCRDIFITALLMARPEVFDKPVQTLDVDSGEPDGWTLPAGEYGFVRAAGPALGKIAMVDGWLEALVSLASPEQASRSRGFGGRRMVRVDGGFVVLNYMAHRDRDTTSAARSKRYRLNQSEKRHAVTSRDITQAEAEAEADLIPYSPPSQTELELDVTSPVKPGGGTDGFPKQEPEQKPVRGKRPSRTMPSGWAPNDWHRSFAAESKLDLDREAERFKDHHEARGSVFASWDAAFRTWLRNAVKFASESGERRGPHHVGGPEQVPDFLKDAARRGVAADREARRRKLEGGT